MCCYKATLQTHANNSLKLKIDPIESSQTIGLPQEFFLIYKDACIRTHLPPNFNQYKEIYTNINNLPLPKPGQWPANQPPRFIISKLGIDCYRLYDL